MPISTNNNKKRKASDDHQVVVDDVVDRDRGGRGAASATSIEDLVATMIEYTRKADIRANKAEIRQENGKLLVLDLFEKLLGIADGRVVHLVHEKDHLLESLGLC